MNRRHRQVSTLVLCAAGAAGLATASEAQSLGTFRWQLEPYCNVVTLRVTQNAATQDPLRIGTLDADGVALAAVKALEARTRGQTNRIDALERSLADAFAAIHALQELHR